MCKRGPIHVELLNSFQVASAHLSKRGRGVLVLGWATIETTCRRLYQYHQLFQLFFCSSETCVQFHFVG